MFDEPFVDAPERGTWRYRLLDSLLLLVMSLFWWVYCYAGVFLAVLNPSKTPVGSEWEL